VTDNMLIWHPTKQAGEEVGSKCKGEDVSLVYISVLQKLTWMCSDTGVVFNSAHTASKFARHTNIVVQAFL